MDEKKLNGLLEKASKNRSRSYCFARLLKGDAKLFLEAAILANRIAKQDGELPPITYVGVFKVLTEDLAVPTNQNSVLRHMKGECRCPKIK